ncbi:hypothetical protein [Sphingobacterium sp. SGL-16]|uniref:hypothetical protein n=1 Tax=Sphingobacterium sp. SGL-16 TaxID=2710883 RepID=UPI0013EBD1F9|nr:hypothetical protein [Sphingobacterium sp. SGL-16]NGM72193.1 hypothetical protein [Sphingobacterium sp. SGL-16]
MKVRGTIQRWTAIFGVALATIIQVGCQKDLDGVDLDNEYANYGANGTDQPNSSSFVYLVTALRDLMPDKIISFYNIGPSASRLSFNGVTVGPKVDYAWNPYYSTYSAPNIPGLDKSRLGAAAIDVNSTSSSTLTSFANRTKTDGYGVFLYYDLRSTNIASYLSGASNILYGQNTSFDNGTTIQRPLRISNQDLPIN